MTVLKPGDRVHVEFDGTLHCIYGDQTHVTLGPEQHQYGVPLSAVSRIEPPRPEWADREGTIAMTRSGTAIQRNSNKWYVPGFEKGYTFSEATAFCGPLTLLRDPAADHE